MHDERLKPLCSPLRKAMLRPELGAICGTFLVFLFFFLVARDTGMFRPRAC